MTHSVTTHSVSTVSLNAEKSFADHIKATLVLGFPLVGAQLAQMAISVSDTIMIGWLGAHPLAAIVLGTQLFFIVFIFGSGMAIAITPITANALGAGDKQTIRRCLRMGLWATIIYSFLGLAIMWQSKAIYTFLGQEAENILLAEDYLLIAMWGIFPTMMSTAMRSFLTALELTRVVLLATIGGVFCNIVLNYILIFGNFWAPRLEIVGAAWASLATQTLILIISVIYILVKKQTAQYKIFTRIWIMDWPALQEVCRLGLPIGIMIVVEVGMFHATSIMMGWIGTIALAAHGVTLQIASVAFMVPLGFANVATIRVGNAFGQKNLLAIGRAGYAALYITLIGGIVTALLIAFFPHYLASLFLDLKNSDSPQVLAYAVPLLFVAAAFQVFDSTQVAIVGAFRGMKDIITPMKMTIFTYWVVGLPVAYILAFPLQLGGVGLWLGLAFGLALAAILMIWRFYNRERLGLLGHA